MLLRQPLRASWLPFAGVALLAAGLLAGWFSGLGFGPVVHAGAVPAELTVPAGSVLRHGDGVPVVPLAVSGGVRETWMLPLLMPGTYALDVPAAGLGGRAVLRTVPVVLGWASYDSAAVGPGVVPGWWWLAVVTTAAVLAVLGGRRVRLVAVLVAVTASLVAVLTGGPGLLGGAAGLLGLTGAVMIVGWLCPRRGSRVLRAVAAGAVTLAALLPGLPAGLLLGTGGVAACLAVAGRIRPRTGAALLGVALLLAGVSPVLDARVQQGQVPAPVTVAQCLDVLQWSAPSAVYGDCWRAIAVQASSAADPAGALEAALEEGYRAGMRPGPECRIAGDALGSALAAREEQPRVLLPELRSLCDFSLLHGWSIGVLHGVPADRMPEVAAQACAPPGPVGMPGPTFVTQCWHGIGQGVARLSGFDVDLADRVCSRAPEGPDTNCSEGFVAEASDELHRSWDGPGFVRLPAGTDVASLCEGLPARFAHGCYRYVGAQFAVQARGKDTVPVVAEQTARLCAQLTDPARSEGCWSGLGSVVVQYPSGYSDAAKLADLRRWCGQAPELGLLDRCVQRGIENFIPLDLTAEQIEQGFCPEISVPNRERACIELKRLAGTLVGKDS